MTNHDDTALTTAPTPLYELIRELVDVTNGYREYIAALPDDVVARLPAMPGIDGDWADEIIYRAERVTRGD
jgi:hypothetical protein